MKILESHIVPEVPENIRLQEYAHTIFQNLFSRSATKKAIKKGLILIDDDIGATGSWIHCGQKLELIQKEQLEQKIFRLKIEVVSETDDYAIINKPSGYPTNGNYFKTIQNALPFNLKKSSASNSLSSPLPVHRLDNPTSGLLLIAKTISAQNYFYQLWENNLIEKTYHAVIEGDLRQTKTISENIDGKPSETLIIPFKNSNGNTLIKVHPKSGRTHQIRKHLSGIALPIVGDENYGSNIKLSYSQGICLAATGIKFPVINSSEDREVTIDVPEKFFKYL